MDSIRPKTKELVTFSCGCHGNLVTIAMRFVANAYCNKEPPYQIWNQYNSLQFKTKELLTYYCGCYGNLVTITTRYAADAC